MAKSGQNRLDQSKVQAFQQGFQSAFGFGKKKKKRPKPSPSPQPIKR